MTKEKKSSYSSNYKPLSNKGGSCWDGNMAGRNNNDSNRLFTVGNPESFNGFAGTTEFESFPLRQLFLNKFKKFPCEWDTGYLREIDVCDYISKHEKCVIATHYQKNKGVNKCALYLGGKEHVFVYLYNRGHYDGSKDKFGVCLLFTQKTKRVEKIMDSFIDLVIDESNDSNIGYLNILTKSSYGLTLDKKEIKSPDIDFSINYNEDFEPVHKKIVERLSIDNAKGLVLLHGLPGAGKTTYIRYLINVLKKKVIYIPPNMASSISDPEFVKFLMGYTNSILIIEDAENILMKRITHSTQAVSNILNLSDGLLSDCLNIQIVATFNTDLKNLDEALLREGRLIEKYEFKKLDEDRAAKLSKKLGVNIKGEHTLAEIYNSEDTSHNNSNKKIKIGFN